MVNAAPAARPLVVWANGARVGTWSVQAGVHHFQYDEAWIGSALGRPLSLSLPFTPRNAPYRGEVVLNYFDNLLPDSPGIRQRLRSRFGTGRAEAFELLAAIGRDCVGAIQLLAEGEEPRGYDGIAGRPLDEQGVERALDQIFSSDRVAGTHDEDGEFRISIAGAQEKTALLKHQGRWHLPSGATATTHIFKLPLGLVGGLRLDMRESVENEWLSARLLRNFGLPVARSDIARFGRYKVLVVERFDRQVLKRPDGKAWIARIPQEDFCQATGINADMKYESKGGPGVRDILRLLSLGSRPAHDTSVFARSLLLFWLMAAIDGHAKNFSIFLEPGGGYRLTPLYDVLSAWPIIGNGRGQLHFNRARMAMALRATNAHYAMREVRTRHWKALAERIPSPDAFDAMVALVLLVPQVLEQTREELPHGFPMALFESVRRGMTNMATIFVDGLAEIA